MDNKRFARLVKSAIDEEIPLSQLDVIANIYDTNQEIDKYIGTLDNQEEFRDVDGTLIIKELVAAIIYSIHILSQREKIQDFNQIFCLLQNKIFLDLTFHQSFVDNET